MSGGNGWHMSPLTCENGATTKDGPGGAANANLTLTPARCDRDEALMSMTPHPCASALGGTP